MNEQDFDTVGEFMDKENSKWIRNTILIGGLVVYLAFIFYSAVHNWSLMSKGVVGEARLWAGVGVFAIEISAILLPLALHFWCFSQAHRALAAIFYAIDFILIVTNIVIDYSAVGGNEVIPNWLVMYKWYIVPITPVFAAFAWAMLFLTDPEQKARIALQKLHATLLELKTKKMESQARVDLAVQKQLERAAMRDLHQLSDSTLGGRSGQAQDMLPFMGVDMASGPSRTAVMQFPLEPSLDAIPEPLPGENGRSPKMRAFNTETPKANPTLPQQL